MYWSLGQLTASATRERGSIAARVERRQTFLDASTYSRYRMGAKGLVAPLAVRVRARRAADHGRYGALRCARSDMHQPIVQTKVLSNPRDVYGGAAACRLHGVGRARNHPQLRRI